ncbi:taste receptor type 2 member 40-like [Hyla sarda]|uniref:taste receptor type 2 member 40-like n=1 Tax=Hyla sarda TaxID=327740 RepID=UPI0024C45053|nr:taste receptor type 2 member 40-like [Hyla sarda]
MFILVVNILDWMKNKRLDISDQLISGISLILLIHRFLLVIVHFIVITKENHANVLNVLSITLLYLSLMLCTLLFSTWLAIHFCLKIVNINHKLYIYIQRKFPKMFPWILLLSIVASFLVSSPAALRLSHEPSLNSTQSLQDPDFIDLDLLFYAPYIVFSSFCLLLFSGSALNIVLSLYRHIKQIHNNNVQLSAQIVQAHVTAMKTILSLLAYNLFFIALLASLIVRLVFKR